MGMDFAVQALPPYTAMHVPRRDPCARRQRPASLGLFAVAAFLLACSGPPAPERIPAPEAVAPPELAPPPATDCPAGGIATTPMPRTRPEHETLAYWLARTQEVADLDRPILDDAAVQSLNDAAEHSPALGFGGRVDLLAPIDVAALARGLQGRLGYLRERFTTNKYVRLDGAPLPAELQARYGGEVMPEALAQDIRGPIVGLSMSEGAGPKGQVPKGSQPDLELRVALDLIPIYCGPQTEPYYTPSRDPDFDRNLCSMARAQELVQILRPWAGDLVLARTSYVVGWIDLRTAALSPPLSSVDAQRFLRGPHRRVGAAIDLPLEGGGSQALPFAALVPVAPGEPGRVLVATAAGVRSARSDDPRFADSPRPLTRRAVLEEAFSYLGERYGWGDRNGGRDCSRYLMDLFAGLGVQLPRHTSDQAIAGSYTVEVDTSLPEPDRLQLLDTHHRRGVLLLHFPGHIMLYLGRDEDGTPMAIHSFAEYLVPCSGRPDGAAAGERETLLKVDGVHVSDLELGRGTSRTAFIQRITKITVFGPRR
jgi:hypothetical protein